MRGKSGANSPEYIFEAFPAKRMEPFLKAAQGDKVQALELYKWNVRMSAASLELIAYVEVILRHAIDRTLRDHSGEDSCGIPWFLRERYISKKDAEKIVSVRRTLADMGKETRDQIIAGMEFGFWSNLLSDEDLWRKALYKAFPDARSGRRKDISRLLEQIRKFRNRIAHHDSLLQVDIVFEVAAIFDLVKAIDGEWMKWLEGVDRTREVAAERPIQNLDTVVVPAKDAWKFYLETGIYVCQVNRFFQPVKYMAFYAGKKVQKEIARIKLRKNNVNVSRQQAEKLQKSKDEQEKLLGRAMVRALDYGLPSGIYQVFVLTRPGETVHGHLTLQLDFPNLGDNAFVRKQRYTSTHKLQLAESIEDL